MPNKPRPENRHREVRVEDDLWTAAKAACDKLEGTYKETCMELFINASSCKIAPPEDGNVDACIASKSGDWVDSNMSED